ncbi:MAG: hypothetical protein ACWGQW_15915, partial [bacterium]
HGRRYLKSEMVIHPELCIGYAAHAGVGSRPTIRELLVRGFKEVGGHHHGPVDMTDPTLPFADLWEEDLQFRDIAFFTTIRDPYDWALSRWSTRFTNNEPIPLITKEWVESWPQRMPWHFRHPGRIWRFLYELPNVDVFRFESLEESLRLLFNTYTTRKPLQAFERSSEHVTWNKPEGDPMKWWSKDALDYFHDVYGEELERTAYAR